MKGFVPPWRRKTLPGFDPPAACAGISGPTLAGSVAPTASVVSLVVAIPSAVTLTPPEDTSWPPAPKSSIWTGSVLPGCLALPWLNRARTP
jgi:hypothetical protein